MLGSAVNLIFLNVAFIWGRAAVPEDPLAATDFGRAQGGTETDRGSGGRARTGHLGSRLGDALFGRVS